MWYCFTNLCSTSPLQNIATAAALNTGLNFCQFLASIKPAKLNERSTRAAVVGNNMYSATASYIKEPQACQKV